MITVRLYTGQVLTFPDHTSEEAIRRASQEVLSGEADRKRASSVGGNGGGSGPSFNLSGLRGPQPEPQPPSPVDDPRARTEARLRTALPAPPDNRELPNRSPEWWQSVSGSPTSKAEEWADERDIRLRLEARQRDYPDTERALGLVDRGAYFEDEKTGQRHRKTNLNNVWDSWHGGDEPTRLDELLDPGYRPQDAVDRISSVYEMEGRGIPDRGRREAETEVVKAFVRGIPGRVAASEANLLLPLQAAEAGAKGVAEEARTLASGPLVERAGEAFKRGATRGWAESPITKGSEIINRDIVEPDREWLARAATAAGMSPRASAVLDTAQMVVGEALNPGNYIGLDMLRGVSAAQRAGAATAAAGRTASLEARGGARAISTGEGLVSGEYGTGRAVSELAQAKTARSGRFAPWGDRDPLIYRDDTVNVGGIKGRLPDAAKRMVRESGLSDLLPRRQRYQLEDATAHRRHMGIGGVPIPEPPGPRPRPRDMVSREAVPTPIEGGTPESVARVTELWDYASRRHPRIARTVSRIVVHDKPTTAYVDMRNRTLHLGSGADLGVVMHELTHVGQRARMRLPDTVSPSDPFPFLDMPSLESTAIRRGEVYGQVPFRSRAGTRPGVGAGTLPDNVDGIVQLDNGDISDRFANYLRSQGIDDPDVYHDLPKPKQVELDRGFAAVDEGPTTESWNRFLSNEGLESRDYFELPLPERAKLESRYRMWAAEQAEGPEILEPVGLTGEERVDLSQRGHPEFVQAKDPEVLAPEYTPVDQEAGLMRPEFVAPPNYRIHRTGAGIEVGVPGGQVHVFHGPDAERDASRWLDTENEKLVNLSFVDSRLDSRLEPEGLGTVEPHPEHRTYSPEIAAEQEIGRRQRQAVRLAAANRPSNGSLYIEPPQVRLPEEIAAERMGWKLPDGDPRTTRNASLESGEYSAGPSTIPPPRFIRKEFTGRPLSQMTREEFDRRAWYHGARRDTVDRIIEVDSLQPSSEFITRDARIAARFPGSGEVAGRPDPTGEIVVFLDSEERTVIPGHRTLEGAAEWVDNREANPYASERAVTLSGAGEKAAQPPVAVIPRSAAADPYGYLMQHISRPGSIDPITTPEGQTNIAAQIDPVHGYFGDPEVAGYVIEESDKVFRSQGPPQTWSTLEEMAVRRGLSTDQLLADRTHWNVMPPEVRLRTLYVIKGKEQARNELQAKLAAGTATDADKAELLHTVEVIGDLTRLGAKAGSAYGRALNSLKMEARNALLEPQMMRQKIYKQYEKEIDANRDILDALARLDPNNPEELMAFQRLVDRPKFREYLQEYWIASVLSGPATHERNAIGNTVNAIMENAVVRPMSAGFDWARTAGTNAEREIFLRETPEALIGLTRGIRQGARRGLEVLKRGYPTNTHGAPSGKLMPVRSAFARSQNRVVREVVGPIVTMPLRLLSASDELFKAMNHTAELYAQAAKAAKKAGLTGRGLTDEIARLVQNPTDEMIEAADSFALKATFNDETSAIGKAIMNLRDLPRTNPESRIGRLGTETYRAGAGFIIPFVRIADRLMVRGFEYTPLGAIKSIAARQSGNLVESADLAARSAIGSVIMAYAASLAYEGRLTAGAPVDDRERAAFYAAQKQPWSVRTEDGLWIPYGGLQPVGTPFALAAAAWKGWKEGDEAPNTERVGHAASMVGQYVTDQSFMEGLSKFMEAIEGGEGAGRAFSDLAAGTIGGFAPYSGLQRSVAQAIDRGRVIDAKTIGDRIKRNIPGMSLDMRGKLTPWGEEVHAVGGAWRSILAPGSILLPSQEQEDPLDAELARLDMPLGMVGKSMADKLKKRPAPGSTKTQTDWLDRELNRLGMPLSYVDQKVSGMYGNGKSRGTWKLDDDEWHMYQQTAGRATRKVLERLFSRADYAGWDSDRQRDEVERAIGAAREYAKMWAVRYHRANRPRTMTEVD